MSLIHQFSHDNPGCIDSLSCEPASSKVRMNHKAETQTGRWKASPFTKLDRLLRETGVPLGLLTNGVEWRLVYAEKSLTTASITWTANEWSSEKTKLDAFYTLLNARRFIGTRIRKTNLR